jgi:outer membrane protein assembly factor BamA
VTKAPRAPSPAPWSAWLLVLAWTLAPLLAAHRALADDARTAPPAVTVPSVAPPPDLRAFLGKPVTRVLAVLDDETWTDIPPPKLGSVGVGEPFTPGLARRLLALALKAGLFGRGRVSVLADGAGVKLVVHVVPRKEIKTLHLDVHGARLDRDEVLGAAGLSVGGELIARDLPDAKERVKAVLRRHGYPEGDVTFTLREMDDPTGVVVMVEVLPGAPARISRRVLYVFGADPTEIDAVTSTYAIDARDRLDDARIAAADTDLTARLRARGYHRATVRHDVLTSGEGAVLRVRIDTGAKFSTRYEGNDSFDKDALDAALGLDEETDRSNGHLVQKLRMFYMSRGFLDVEVTVDVRGDVPDAKVAYLVFHVRESRRVAVVSRAYPCLKEAAIRGLTGDAPNSPKAIGDVIDAFLEDDLPGAGLAFDPDPETLDKVLSGPGAMHSDRAVPLDLDPDSVFVDETYERAVLHVQELLRNEGFLHALVGPVQVMRRRCDPRSPPGECRPKDPPHQPQDACAYDATNLPVEDTRIDAQLTCVPDRAHGIECERRISLRIPVKLGPRTVLYDMGFRGARSIDERKLAQAASLVLGTDLSSLALEDARRRVLDAYREEGFAYADVKVSIEESLDHTHARATFDVVEGEQVIVGRILIRGNDVTQDSVIRRRVALVPGQPYRASLVRKTQSQVATLNVFSTVNVSLDNAYLPQARKDVIITVVEQLSQYLETRPGLSTGEGIRLGVEYGDRNLLGAAVGFAFRAQLSYLPDFLILDPQVKTNFDTLGNPGLNKRLAGRLTGTFTFPDIGLGPLIRASTDAIGVRDLERDFYLTKGATILNLFYRPFRQLQFSISPDIELNDVGLFQNVSLNQYIQSVGGNPELSALLRVPQGTSYALAQRFAVTWDRRDNAFNAHSGTLFTSGVEHIDWTSISSPSCAVDPSVCNATEGHAFRFTETFAGYIPLGKKVRVAAEIRFGVNVQTTGGSSTYPDRLFFMGGADSMRGWLQDTFVPQEYADQLQLATTQTQLSVRGLTTRTSLGSLRGVQSPNPFTIADVGLRGGNMMLNPRLELRFPIREPLESVLFCDAGNLWLDPLDPFRNPSDLTLAYAAGTGLRLQTPIGPIAIDYGVNLSRLFSSDINPRRNYEDFGAFDFSIGLF